MVKSRREVLMCLALTVLTMSIVSCSKGGKVLLIVEGDNVKFMGDVEFKRGEDGTMRPNVWIPGNIVIFRTDGEFGSEKGKAGNVYRIVKAGNDFKIQAIGKVDVTLSDDELQKRYLSK